MYVPVQSVAELSANALTLWQGIFVLQLTQVAPLLYSALVFWQHSRLLSEHRRSCKAKLRRQLMIGCITDSFAKGKTFSPFLTQAAVL